MATLSPARRATLVTTCASLGLVALKTFAGLMSGSVAVLASALDSLLDSLVSLINAFAVRGAEKPRDHDHNYGHGKLEGVAALFEGLFILGSAGYVLWRAMEKFLNPRPIPTGGLDLAMGVMVFSMLSAAAIVAYLRHEGRKTRSLVLEADTLHYRTDVWSNGAVLAGMLVIRVTGWQAADAIVAAGIGLYIAWAALPLFRKSLDMLMDRALPDDVSAEILEIARSHSELVNGVHELRTRRSGEINFVELHLVFNEQIPLGRAHRVADEIEARIRALEKSKWSVNIHLDPVDDSYRDRKLAEEG
jgi:cation diffusion facilitator family transporter